MGFFSKTCAKTHMPIVNIHKGFPRFHTIVALTPDGKVMEGIYDGYGRVNDVDILEDMNMDDWDKVKFVLRDSYKGEKYHELGKSRDELGQGWFMSDKFLLFCAMRDGFKSYAEYKKYFKKYADWI
jgi:hypothetical protein